MKVFSLILKQKLGANTRNETEVNRHGWDHALRTKTQAESFSTQNKCVNPEIVLGECHQPTPTDSKKASAMKLRGRVGCLEMEQPSLVSM